MGLAISFSVMEGTFAQGREKQRLRFHAKAQRTQRTIWRRICHEFVMIDIFDGDVQKFMLLLGVERGFPASIIGNG
jgi:hypothetical protein